MLTRSPLYPCFLYYIEVTNLKFNINDIHMSNVTIYDAILITSFATNLDTIVL